MIKFNESQRTILTILGDGLCHSGSELGKALGISRTAIWKQINQLLDWGIKINRLPQQGYQLLNPLILLDQEKINTALQDLGFSKPVHMHLFSSIDSTNSYLKELAPTSRLELCVAERQTQGRGRFGRQWHSPFGENIYCSTRWNFNCDLTRLSGLSLVSSLAILKTIHGICGNEDIKIKWPNDILWLENKLCGSLIEILAESNGSAQVIIGVGMNVNSDTLNQALEDIPWCSLFAIFATRYDRNVFIARLIYNLDLYLENFINNGLEPILDEWNQHDYLRGKFITVTQNSVSIAGIAQGINALGQLILTDEKGLVHTLSAGDASLAKLN